MRAWAVFFVAGVVLATNGAAAYAEGVYVGGQIGISGGSGEFDNSGFDLELDTGHILSGFLGIDRGNVRFEGEISYRQNDMDNVGGIPVIGEMSSTALMGNFYYDFGDGSGIVPYLGAGLGLADITFESAATDSETAFAFQLMAGLAFPVSETMAVTAELRSFGAYPEFQDNAGLPFEQEYFIASLALGLRASF